MYHAFVSDFGIRLRSQPGRGGAWNFIRAIVSKPNQCLCTAKAPALAAALPVAKVAARQRASGRFRPPAQFAWNRSGQRHNCAHGLGGNTPPLRHKGIDTLNGMADGTIRGSGSGGKSSCFQPVKQWGQCLRGTRIRRWGNGHFFADSINAQLFHQGLALSKLGPQPLEHMFMNTLRGNGRQSRPQIRIFSNSVYIQHSLRFCRYSH